MKLIQICKKIAQTSGLLSLARQTVPGNCTPVAEFGLVMNRFSSESCRLYLYMESNSFSNLSDTFSGSYSFTVLNKRVSICLIRLSARLAQFRSERI